MARPQKEGLEYFPIVTSFDEKIELIIAEFGPEGLGVIIGLLQRIYTNSYYIDWNEDTLMLFATKHINAEITRVNAVLIRCFDRNIFNKSLYDKYKVLTSRGIQKQYLKVCRDSRRKSVQFIKEYCLVDDAELTKVITEFIRVNAEETPENDVQSTQRKEKKRESKEKESKEKEGVNENSQTLSLYVEKITCAKWFIAKDTDQLNVLIEMYTYDWVKDAVDEAALKKKYSISYIEGILKNWTSEGKGVANVRGNNKQNSEPADDYDFSSLRSS